MVVGFSSYTSVDSELAKHGVSSTNETRDDHEGCGSSGEIRQTWPGPVMRFAEAHVAYKSV